MAKYRILMREDDRSRLPRHPLRRDGRSPADRARGSGGAERAVGESGAVGALIARFFRLRGRWLYSGLPIGLFAMYAAFLSLVVQTSTAYACSCVARTREEHIETATRIFRGTVTQIRSAPGNEIASYRALFRVSTIWKGKAETEIPVYFSGFRVGACGYPFEIGEDYLVFVTTLRERDGSEWPYTGWCMLTDPYSDEVAADLGPPLVVGPTPVPKPTSPVCPAPTTEVPRVPTRDPDKAESMLYLPLTLRLSSPESEMSPSSPYLDPIDCVTATPTPDPRPTPTPFFETPPIAYLQENGARGTSGIGSYCWWIADDECHDAPGIATTNAAQGTKSPSEFNFVLAPDRVPDEVSLSIGAVEDEDEVFVEGSRNRYWSPKKMTDYYLPISDDLKATIEWEPGVYVVRLRVQWGSSADDPLGLGWVEYGWRVEVLAPDSKFEELLNRATFRTRSEARIAVFDNIVAF